MNIEHFTEKAREAISDAAQLARQHNHAQVEVEHLLAALLAQEGGVVQQVIAKVGGNLAAAQGIVNDALERLPQVYGGSEPGISPRLRKVLEDAWREMGAFHDEYLSVEHLLLAMLDESGSTGPEREQLSRAWLLSPERGVRGSLCSAGCRGGGAGPADRGQLYCDFHPAFLRKVREEKDYSNASKESCGSRDEGLGVK